MNSPKTTTEKGRAFEKKVARWARKKFNLEGLEFNHQFKGKIGVRPFEVDIVGWKKNLMGYTVVVWIECKDRKASIKRTDINTFFDKAKDVRAAVPALTWSGLSEEQTKMNWDDLMFASTSVFDQDALAFAKKNKVSCYYCDGKIFRETK